MLPILRAVLCHLLGVALAVHVLTQCHTLSRFQSPSAAEKKAAEENVSQAEDVDQEKAEQIGDDVRFISADQTPFFRWLRSGLRSGAKPSRFLDKGTKVELLKEDEEKGFSQVRLPEGRKGWVPSRLILEKTADAAEDENGATDEEPASRSAAAAPDLSDTLPEPSQLPGAEAGLPPITEDIGSPIIPNVGITPPAKIRPATAEQEDEDESDATEQRDDEEPDQ